MSQLQGEKPETAEKSLIFLRRRTELRRNVGDFLLTLIKRLNLSNFPTSVPESHHLSDPFAADATNRLRLGKVLACSSGDVAHLKSYVYKILCTISDHFKIAQLIFNT